MALEQPQITRLLFTEGICPGIYAAKYVRAFHQFGGGPTARYPFYSAAVGGDEPSPYCAYAMAQSAMGNGRLTSQMRSSATA